MKKYLIKEFNIHHLGHDWIIKLVFKANSKVEIIKGFCFTIKDHWDNKKIAQLFYEISEELKRIS